MVLLASAIEFWLGFVSFIWINVMGHLWRLQVWHTQKGMLVYEGQYKDDCGDRFMFLSATVFFNGQFNLLIQDDLKHGHGKFVWPDGKPCMFLSLCLIICSCFGYTSGFILCGSGLCLTRCGKNLFIFSTKHLSEWDLWAGRTYDGEWSQGKRHGRALSTKLLRATLQTPDLDGHTRVPPNLQNAYIEDFSVLLEAGVPTSLLKPKGRRIPEKRTDHTSEFQGVET